MNLRKTFIFICFQVFGIIPIIEKRVDEASSIFVLSILLASVCFNIMRDKIIGWLISVVIVVMFNINNKEYLFLSLFVLILAITYKETLDRDNVSKKDFSTIFIIISICFGIFVLIYSISSYFAVNQQTYFTDFSHKEYIIVFFLLVALFCMSVVARRSIDNNSAKLRIVYFINIIFYIEMLFFCYVSLNGDSHHCEVILFPWYAYLCMLVCDEDPVVMGAFKTVDKKVTNFIEKTR